MKKYYYSKGFSSVSMLFRVVLGNEQLKLKSMFFWVIKGVLGFLEDVFAWPTCQGQFKLGLVTLDFG